MAPAGCPRLYHTDQERKQAAKERNARYYDGHRDYVLQQSAARYERKKRQEEVTAMIRADPVNKLMKQRLLTTEELLNEATSQHDSLRRHTGGSFRDYQVKDEITRIEQIYGVFRDALTGLEAVCGGIEAEQMQSLVEANTDFETVGTYLTDLLKHVQKKTLSKALTKRTLACSTFPKYEPKKYESK
ncbi:hypothetical protein BDZ89DRAFT_1146423 [Hymenopellis radicata]|nr:hypothetical protein BDZ89DRAFT_1146423 [Hymenopellis radicata]